MLKESADRNATAVANRRHVLLDYLTYATLFFEKKWITVFYKLEETD